MTKYLVHRDCAHFFLRVPPPLLAAGQKAAWKIVHHCTGTLRKTVYKTHCMRYFVTQYIFLPSIHSPDMTYDTLQTSQCNNCNAGDDMSNYWVPQLYIHKQVSNNLLSLLDIK